jgi:hypothetical protein
MAPLTIGDLEIPWIDTLRPEDSTSMAPYNKQTRRTDVLPKGWQKEPGKRILDCDIIYDQNIEIFLRDGTKVSRTYDICSRQPAFILAYRSMVTFYDP